LQILQDNTGILNVTWFPDETHFHLDGYINKKNVQFWASENPRLIIANPLHPEKVTAWCALFSIGVFSPIFINGINTSNVYLSLLGDEFVPFLIGF
jgi:hypothetical protein